MIVKQGTEQRVSTVTKTDNWKVPPGFEPGLFGSEPKVMTTTLWNHTMFFSEIVT